MTDFSAWTLACQTRIEAVLTWNETLALRAGWQTLFQEDAELGGTLGMGLRGDLGENTWRVDYAWADHDHLEGTHRMTLVLEL